MGKAGDGLYRALGLMSGTSMDGIDVALIETDGAGAVRRVAARTFGYDEAFRDRLREAIRVGQGISQRAARPGCLGDVERELTDLHGEATAALLKDIGLGPDDVDVVGFHGQTILHRPEERLTVQIGDGWRLAKLTGIDVVYDLRAADCAAGGQGAPLVPVYHAALARRLPDSTVAFVNIGGVSNITFVRDGVPVVAFDCGPGNAMIDDWMMAQLNVPCDVEGALARSGQVDEERVRRFFRHTYFAMPAPKSLDRGAFGIEFLAGLTTADGAATASAIAATAIARSRAILPSEPRLWVITGGGRRNKALMAMIAERVQNAVVPAEAVGLNGDSMEAEAWAYLAVRSLRRLALTFPGTTGVESPITGGIWVKAEN